MHGIAAMQGVGHGNSPSYHFYIRRENQAKLVREVVVELIAQLSRIIVFQVSGFLSP